MDEFVSELEGIMKAVELNFDPTPGFGKYKEIMPEEAIAHPAKFNTNLVEFLIKKFTEEGETVLDPMAGTGVLGVVAALHGRNAIQVELESKFFDWMEKARKNVEKLPTLTPKGRIVNICGDARRLSELLGKGQTDAVITSPPYSESLQTAHDWERENKKFLEKTQDKKRKGKQWVHARPGDRYSENPSNIGNLPHGNIDAIITSPPYADAKKGGEADEEKMAERWDRAFRQTGTYATRLSFGVPIGYSPNKNNIGNLKSSDKEYEALRRGLMTKSGKPTYLSEMLKVYREMWKVLKPGGRAIIVVKPFIRNKRVVDLPYHTYLLMRLAGFELEQLYKLRLKQVSFWRVLYERRYPEVPKLRHEYVLVCKKP